MWLNDPRWHIGGVLLLTALSGCQKMGTGGRVREFEPNSFFPDGASARFPVSGTVPVEAPRGDEALLHGTRGGVLVERIPLPVTDALLRRGRERIEISCVPCHGFLGDGKGMIVRRGFSAPPSFHTEQFRKAPAGKFFKTITEGEGAMASYRDRVSVPDRWAIVAYIRALQLSQHPEAMR
jgi:hypothetical protein